MRRGRHLVPLPLLLVLALVGSPMAESQPREGKPGASQGRGVTAIPITVGRAEARAVQRSVETSGSLLAWEEVQAKTEQPGTIAHLYVDMGDRVSAGQPLAEYDRREFELAVQQAEADLSAAQESLARARATVLATEAQLRRVRDTQAILEADLARAESQFEWAKSELQRTQQLNQRELIAARDVDNARNQYNVAATQVTSSRIALAQHPDQMRIAESQLQSDRAAVKSAEAQVRQREATLGLASKRLGDTTVRAPIGGLVARRLISAGEYVKENTALFIVVISHPLKYTGTVPERFAPSLTVGQTIKLTTEAYRGREFTGTVIRLAPAVDVQTRTLALEARVPNESGALRPGFFAKGEVLTLREAAAVFVPAEAITYVAGLSKVFVVTGQAVQERLVRPGERQGSLIEVIEGVKSGETVATSNLPSLYNGAPVTIPGR